MKATRPTLACLVTWLKCIGEIEISLLCMKIYVCATSLPSTSLLLIMFSLAYNYLHLPLVTFVFCVRGSVSASRTINLAHGYLLLFYFPVGQSHKKSLLQDKSFPFWQPKMYVKQSKSCSTTSMFSSSVQLKDRNVRFVFHCIA